MLNKKFQIQSNKTKIPTYNLIHCELQNQKFVFRST